jgi:hypothetical protein
MASTHGWRKSSYSGAKEHCVEIAPAERAVLVRDTKDHDTGPILAFPRAPWAAFLTAVRAGEFD